MKVIRIIFLVFFMVFAHVIQAGTPPAPPLAGRQASVAQTAAVDPVDGAPIDQDIVFLMMAGLVLGTVFIYRNKIKKASM